MTTSARRILIAAAVVAAAFLTGFLIQFGRARNLNRSLETARAELNACQRRNDVAGLRDLMGLTYLEVNRKNYGLAQQHASRFFERVRELRGQAADPALEAVLNQAAAERDEIIAALARGDAAVQERVQKVYGALLEARPQVSPAARR
jgi:hypothetical protein